MIKQCKSCLDHKEVNSINFQPSFNKKTNKIYFKNKCRLCEKNSCRQYHKNNRDKILFRKNKYDKSHINERIEYRKEYNQRPEAKKLNSKKALKRYYLNKNNPLYFLRKKISITVSKQLKKNKSLKNNISILNYLPYTIKQLKQYLESLFEPWMNWENYGGYIANEWNDKDQLTWKWNIDHIIPQADLPYKSMEDENFKKAWALNNLRPYPAKQNLIDGARRIRHKK